MSKGSKNSEPIKKAQYYVQYLGWKECRGLGGREFTEPIVKDLVIRRKLDDLPKLTIEVSKKELKIYQLHEVKRGKTEKIKYPTVPAKDLTYATQGLSPDEDIAACIYLGYNPTTRCAVHVHVYRCDSESTAEVFVRHLNQILSVPDHQVRLAKVEEDLVAKGQITPRPRGFITQYADGQSVVSGTNRTLDTYDQDFSDEDLESMNLKSEKPRPGQQNLGAYPAADRNSAMAGGAGVPKSLAGIVNGGPPPGGREYGWEYGAARDRPSGGSSHKYSNDYEEQEEEEEEDIYRLEKAAKQETLAMELRSKLGLQSTPILLPPKDYDTVSRAQGNLLGIETRRCQTEEITLDKRKSSGEDSARGESESGSHRNSDDGHHLDMKRAVSPSRGWGREDPRRERPGNRLSSGGDVFADDPDLIPVSPRWKTGGQYVPPQAGRPTSPVSGRPLWDQPSNPMVRPRSPGAERARSPVGERARSPQRHSPRPQGRARSPHHTRPTSPYHMGPGYSHHGNRALSPGRHHDQYYNRDPYTLERDPRSGKKYTATNLGLADPTPGRMRVGPDEGYTSIDRQDMDRQGRPLNLAASAPEAELRHYARQEKPGKKSKDKKDKKDKKGKKGKRYDNPGDDIPIDYTIGPAVAKSSSYSHYHM